MDTDSEDQRRRTEDLLRQLKKLEVDIAQVKYWLRGAHPIADLVASGDAIDGPAVDDVRVRPPPLCVPAVRFCLLCVLHLLVILCRSI